MARRSTPDDRSRGRFSRSAHTSHSPRATPPPPGYDPPPGYPTPEGTAPAGPAFDPPTYHQTTPQPTTAPPRGILGRSNYAARAVTRRVIAASKADGAHESGLTALIWNQVLSYGSDAMVTVALAGTVFFGASPHAQRGNVLLYLVVTMAPFAIVAPIIGPALDRLQHGRRWAMAGTAIGRAILAMIMAAHPTDLLVLYPCALGSLVLSKAYSVIRAAAAPRLVPRDMTLVEANSRLTVFGLVSAIVGGGVVAAVIKISGSYSLGLWVTAIAFATCALFAFRLPPQVDSPAPAPRDPEDAERARRPRGVPPVRRIRAWAKRGFVPQVIISLQGESTLRFLSGLLTIFLAFYIEATWSGGTAALALAGVAVGAGAGNFVGTAIGSRLKFVHPEVLITVCVSVAALACLLTAVLFNIGFAIACMFVSAVCNALSKIALDAVVQRDVAEALRASAFGRSETFLQLSWVIGAAIGVVLPTTNGSLAFWIAGVIMAGVAVVVALRSRAMKRSTTGSRVGRAPGTVASHSPPPTHQPGHHSP